MKQENPEFFIRKQGESEIKKINKKPEKDWSPYVDPAVKKENVEENTDAQYEKENPWVDELVDAAIDKTSEEKEAVKLKKLERKSERSILSQEEAAELRRYKDRQEDKEVEAAVKILAAKEKKPEIVSRVATIKIPVVEEKTDLKPGESKAAIGFVESETIPQEVPAPAQASVLEQREPGPSMKKGEIKTEAPIENVVEKEDEGGDLKIKLTAEDKLAALEFNNSKKYLGSLYKKWYQLVEESKKPSKELSDEIDEVRSEFIDAYTAKIKEEGGGKIDAKRLDFELRKRVGPIFEQIKIQAKEAASGGALPVEKRKEKEAEKKKDIKSRTESDEGLVGRDKLETLEKKEGITEVPSEDIIVDKKTSRNGSDEILEAEMLGSATETKNLPQVRNLDAAREKFARADIDTIRSRKELGKYEDGKNLLDSIKGRDAELISEFDKQTADLTEKGVSATLMTPEEKHAYYDAQARRDEFKAKLKNRIGVSDEDIDKIYSDISKFNGAKDEYLAVLAGVRAEMLEKARAEIKKLGLSPEKESEWMKQKMEEILKTTVDVEANNLYDAKTKMEVEKLGHGSSIDKTWGYIKSVGSWYSRQPLKYKLAVGVGLGLGACVVGTGAGVGAVGLGVAKLIQRGLSTSASMVATEAVVKKLQERHAEKNTLKQFSDKLSGLLKDNSRQLDERLFELEGKKKGERNRRFMLATAAGSLVASGFFGRVINYGVQETGIRRSIKDTVSGWFDEHKLAMVPLTETEMMPRGSASHLKPNLVLPGFGPDEELGQANNVDPQLTPDNLSGIETVQKGDSVWKIIDRQLLSRYGEQFAGMDEARKSYLTDIFKDRIAADPEKFGLTDIDDIKAGQKIDLSSLFEDKARIAGDFHETGMIKEVARGSIAENDELIKKWVQEHPGERLDTQKVDEILRGRGTDNLFSKTRDIFRGIKNPIEKEVARNLTLDKFLRKYFNKI